MRLGTVNQPYLRTSPQRAGRGDAAQQARCVRRTGDVAAAKEGAFENPRESFCFQIVMPQPSGAPIAVKYQGACIGCPRKKMDGNPAFLLRDDLGVQVYDVERTVARVSSAGFARR